MQFKNFQNITSDHKSRNARAGSYDFLLLYSQQSYSNALLCTRYVLHKTLHWFPICSRFIWTNQKYMYNGVTGKSSVKFLKNSESICRKLNFELLKAANVRKSGFNSSISIGLSDLQTLVSWISLHCP